jgi:raffinose/stachyose/melibiose transport system permease protein
MKHRRNFLVAMAFILPALLVYLFYFIIPIPASFYYSFFQWNGLPSQYKLTTPVFMKLEKEEQVPKEITEQLKPLRNKKFPKEKAFLAAVEEHIGRENLEKYQQQFLERAYSGKIFIGLGNWGNLLKDPVFWRALINNIILVIASIALQIPAGIILGVFISSALRGTRIFKLVYFIPMMISSVAIGITWMYVYQPEFGLLNNFLKLIGLEQFALGWLGDPKLALGSVIIATCWQFIPFYMILFAAALSGIPRGIYEAASIDGATGIQSFFRITLPLLKGTIRIACVLSLTGSLRFFDLLYVMTGGGPNHASELLATYMFKQAFTSFNMGYGSTIAVFMFILSFGLALVMLARGKKDEGVYA